MARRASSLCIVGSHRCVDGRHNIQETWTAQAQSPNFLDGALVNDSLTSGGVHGIIEGTPEARVGKTLTDKGGIMPEDRLDRLCAAATESGLTIDYLEFLSRGLDRKAETTLLGNAIRLPAYMKSSDNPYVSRSAKAPLSEMR